MTSNLMKKTLGMLALSVAGLTATGAHAEWGRNAYTPHQDHRHAYQQSRLFSQQVNARQDQQRARIEAGKHAGRLTRAEYRELMHEQHEIRAMERHFRADGIIDAREFHRLERALDVASRSIRAEKHDRETRNAYGQHRHFN